MTTTRARSKKQQELELQQSLERESNNKTSPPMTRSRSKAIQQQKERKTQPKGYQQQKRKPARRNMSDEEYSEEEEEENSDSDNVHVRIEYEPSQENGLESEEEESEEEEQQVKKTRGGNTKKKKLDTKTKSTGKKKQPPKKTIPSSDEEEEYYEEEYSDDEEEEEEEEEENNDSDEESSGSSSEEEKNGKRKQKTQQQSKRQRKRSKNSSTERLYSSDNEQEEDDEEEEEEVEEDYNDTLMDGKDDYDEEEERKDFSDETIEKILAVKSFKGKFKLLPFTLPKYVNLSSSTLLSPQLNNDNPQPIADIVTTPLTSEQDQDEQMINSENKSSSPILTSPNQSSIPPATTTATSISSPQSESGDQVPQNTDNNNNNTVDSKQPTVSTPTPTSTTPLLSSSSPPLSSVQDSNNNKINNASTTTTTTSPMETGDDDDDQVRFLTLFKERSYRSVRWMTLKDIETTNIQVNPKLQLQIKKTIPTPIKDESEANPLHYFKQDYIQVDKILSKETKRKGRGLGVVTYLVKWKDLLHEKSTWENESSLQSPQDKEAIKVFQASQTGYSKKTVARPTKLPAFGPSLVPKFKSSLSLKEFQVEGFLWLSYNWYHERSSLLADEMGLGKTIQSIAFLTYLSQSVGIKGPFMVVAPLSTLGNWQKEILKWTDMKVLVFYGTQETRSFQKKYEWKRKDKGIYQFEVLLTTYETVMAEHADLVKINWRALVLDEGHRIKNTQSKVLSKLKSIKTEHSVILTGTPLQNDMKELWTMLNFLDPEKFNSCTQFLEEFSDLKEESQVQRLHQILSPYLLRRMKEDVELSIPIKEETVIQVELSSIQKTYYRAILEKNREFLARGVRSKSNLPKLTNIMIQIRKVCNHPFLIPGAEDTIIRQEKISTDDQIAELLIRSSSKLVLVDKLLQRLKKEGHRVLIFSQMVESLNILEDYLHYREYSYERLDGSVASASRQASIERFMDKDSDRFVFLLSTRSGGVGINLTSADTVILFDSDWNPQSDLQAQARCHRIGQTSNVKVYRLITRNTYEQYLFEVATKKLLLDHIVLNNAKNNSMKQQEAIDSTATTEVKGGDKKEETQDGEDSGETENKEDKTEAGGEPKDPNTPSEISQMLKYGAAYLFNESAKDASEQDSVMFNEDIDKILERSTTISFDNKNKPSNLSGFSKATFASSETDLNVDLDDENFWEKVLPDYKTVKQLEEKLSSGSVFNSDESRSKYIDDIVELAQSKKDDIIDPISIEFISDLLKLIMRVEFNTKFTPEEREKVQTMRLLLERPRTRKRVIPEVVQTAPATAETKQKGKKTIIPTMPDSDSSSDEHNSDPDFVNDENSVESDDSAAIETKKKIKSNIPVVPVWNKTNKDKLKTIVLKYGLHRWKKIQKELTVTGVIKTPGEIQSITESFIETGYKSNQEQAKETFDTFIEDTSYFNWQKLGFDVDSPDPITENKEASSDNNNKLDKFKLSELPPVQMISSQNITIHFKKEENQNTPTSTTTTSTTTATTSETVVESHSKPSEDGKENGSTIKSEDNNEDTTKDNSSNIVNSNSMNVDSPTTTTSTSTLNTTASPPLPSPPKIETLPLPTLTNRVPQQTDGYYLAIFIDGEKDQLIRVYPIRSDMTSYEFFFPGLSSGYYINIIYTNISQHSYIKCSNDIKLQTVPNIVWQQGDFPGANRIQATLSKISTMRILKRCIVRYGKNLETLKLQHLSRGPTTTWTTENDRALILGIYRYGHGKFAECFSDPSLDLMSAIKKGSLSTSSGAIPNTMQDDDDEQQQQQQQQQGPKIPSSESLRRRLGRVTENIIRQEFNQKHIKQQQQQQQQHQQHTLQQMQQFQQFQQQTLTSDEIEAEYASFPPISQAKRPFSPDGELSDDEEYIKKQQQHHQQQQQHHHKYNYKQHSQQQFRNRNHYQQQQQQQQQSPNSTSPTIPSTFTSKNGHATTGGRYIHLTFAWDSKVLHMGVPAQATLEMVKKMFYVKFDLKNSPQYAETTDYHFRFYYGELPIQPHSKFLVDLELQDGAYIRVEWESKWKTMQVQGFDMDVLYMKVQDDTVLEDIVKAYFQNGHPPYEYKNLRVEYNGTRLELNGDIGSNHIRDDAVLKIVSSSDIIHVHVLPSWNHEEKEIYALHKRTTYLSKLVDSFLKKHSLQPKQINFTNSSTGAMIDPNKPPIEQSLEMDSVIHANLLLSRIDVEYLNHCVPYLLSTNTSFESLIHRFCDRVKISKHTVQFFYDNKKLIPDETPEQIKMGPHANIKVAPISSGSITPQPGIIEVEVRLIGEDAGSYIKMHTHNPFPLEILMDKFCEEHKLNKHAVLFTFNGVKIEPQDTLISIGLRDSDIIEARKMFI